jgi:hypothetical protein
MQIVEQRDCKRLHRLGRRGARAAMTSGRAAGRCNRAVNETAEKGPASGIAWLA